MKNLVDLVKENITISGELQEVYFNILKDNIYDYDTLEDIKDYMGNYCICITGAVSGLIYYSETEKIFKNHFNEILEIFEELMRECGNELLKDMELTANNLVWLTFEETIRNWYFEIENLEE